MSLKFFYTKFSSVFNFTQNFSATFLEIIMRKNMSEVFYVSSENILCATFECFARFFGTAQNNASDYKQRLQVQNKY